MASHPQENAMTQTFDIDTTVFFIVTSVCALVMMVV